VYFLTFISSDGYAINRYSRFTSGDETMQLLTSSAKSGQQKKRSVPACQDTGSPPIYFVCFLIAVTIPAIRPAMMDHPTNTKIAKQIRPAVNETRSQILIIILLSYFEQKKST
jgi:hypothetical protein